MKKLIIALLVFSYVFSPGLLCASVEPNQSAFIWGQEVNGLQAAIEFIPENNTYKQGDVIGILFHLRNVSDHRIQFVTSDWRNEDKCFLKDPNGNEISCNYIGYLGWLNTNRMFLDPCESVLLKSSSFGIAKNKSLESSEFTHPVGAYVYLKPGRYLLYYQLRFPDIRSSSLPDEPNDWIGTLETGRRDFFVLAEPTEPNSSKTQ
jgi:hypothetical protein